MNRLQVRMMCIINVYTLFQHGTSISSLSTYDEGSSRTQPELVCIGHLTSPARQFVIVSRNDRVTIPLHDDSLTCALDKLFKFYWVCNVAYPAQLASVFIFFEHIWVILAKPQNLMVLRI